MSFRVGAYACVFDGQSLNVWPSAGAANSYPIQMMVSHPDAAYGIPAVAGLSWQQLDNDMEPRVGQFMSLSPVIFYIMVGGTTNISVGQTGGGVYDAEVSIAQAARNLADPDITVWVIGTTTTPSTAFNASQNTELGILNAAVIADASNAFDGVAQLAEDPRLSDPANTTYYSDGTHPTTAGAAAIAELVSSQVNMLV